MFVLALVLLVTFGSVGDGVCLPAPSRPAAAALGYRLLLPYAFLLVRLSGILRG